MAQFTYLKTQPKKEVSNTFVIGGEKYVVKGSVLYKPLSDLIGANLLNSAENKDLKTYEWNAKFLKESFESVTCNGANVLESDESAVAFCNELNCAFSWLFEKSKDFSITGKAGN